MTLEQLEALAKAGAAKTGHSLSCHCKPCWAADIAANRLAEAVKPETVLKMIEVIRTAQRSLIEQDTDDDCPCSVTHSEANDGLRAALAKLEAP